jgi:hypothetical protein
MAHNQGSYMDGMRAAGDGVSRDKANQMARGLSVAGGDAFLAGYYAEMRRLGPPHLDALDAYVRRPRFPVASDGERRATRHRLDFVNNRGE